MARAPRPNVTDAADSSITTGLPVRPAPGIPASDKNAAFGCMRAMMGTACKRNANKNRSRAVRFELNRDRALSFCFDAFS
jgi:hypothetical protein